MKSKSIFLTVLLAGCTSLLMAQGTWTQMTNFGGVERCDAVGFAINSKGYVGMGHLGDGIAYKDLWEYDPVVNVWTQKADFGGEPRAQAVGFSIGDNGYVGTGFNVDLFVRYNDFWEYDPLLNAWTEKSSFPGSARNLAVGFSIHDKGYLGMGASFGSYLSDFWQYDSATDTWAQKADFAPGSRSNASAFSINSKGYVALGYTGSSWQKDLWEYDPLNDTWMRKSDFGGTAREGAVGFSIGDKGYVGTGSVYEFSTRDFWEYDPATDTWTRKADFAGDVRSAAVGFSIEDKGFIGTGWENNNPYIFYNDFWEYTPEETTTCATPVVLSTTKITSVTAKLDWDDVSGAIGYGIRYKIAGEKGWTLKTATTSSRKIEGLQPETEYVWSVRTYCSVTPPAITSAWSPNQSFTTGTLRLETPVSTSLEVYPNPFQQSATITYSTASDTRVQIALYDISGKLMKMLVSENASSGMHTLSLNSEGLKQGIYLLKFQVNDELIVKKVVIE